MSSILSMSPGPASPGIRPLLYVAAAFNLAAVPIVCIASRVAPQWLGLEPSASAQFYVDLFAWLVACFGLSYALAAHDWPRFWPFVALGALAKAGVVVLAYLYVFSGAAAAPVAMLATGDAIFVVAFVRALAVPGMRAIPPERESP